MNFIKHIFKKHLQAVLSLGFIIVFATTLHIFALDWPYAPGATLNPGCLPTDPTCIVTIPSDYWSLTGDAGTVDGTNFIGTTDNIPLNFRVNNEKAGRIDNALENAFYGYQAGNSNTIGTHNTASGSSALTSNTTASQNTAFGNNALYTQSFDNLGVAWNSDNVAIGFDALYSNQPSSTDDGIQNTAIGNFALYTNTTGSYNTANGFQALFSNATGERNTANGYNALYNNTEGNYNTANGYEALYNNTIGSENTANGMRALYNNTIGSENTANGNNALHDNTEGNYNTANGTNALYLNTTGGYNTANGYEAGYSSTGSGNVFLGYKAGYYETGDNAFYVDNQDRTDEATGKTNSLIYGVFDAVPANQILTINGQLKISQGVPGAGKVLTSNAAGLATWETPAGGASVVQEIEVDLTADQIKTAFTVPINTGISVGAGEAIEVVSASMKYTFNTTPFDNPLYLYLIIDGMINAQIACYDAGFSGAVADYFLKCSDIGYDASSDQLVDGADLFLKSDTDSVAGDGTAKIYISYRIITL